MARPETPGGTDGDPSSAVPGSPSPPGRAAGTPAVTFEHVLPPQRPGLSAMRRQLADWLRARGASQDDVELVVLACSEAVANAVEHGSPDGEVRISAAVRDGRLRLEVRDAGRWDDSPSEPHRGHGLLLIRRAMNRVRISTDGGTVVHMERALR